MNYRKAITIFFALVITIFVGGVVIFGWIDDKAKASFRQLNIFADNITAIGWGNKETLLSQDLLDASIFDDFSEVNSAYIVSKAASQSGDVNLPETSRAPNPIDTPTPLESVIVPAPQAPPDETIEPSPDTILPVEAPTPLPSESTLPNPPDTPVNTDLSPPQDITPPPEETGLIETLKRKLAPFLVTVRDMFVTYSLATTDENTGCGLEECKQTIEFSGFNIGDNFPSESIDNLQLRFSFAARENVFTSPGMLVLRYSYDSNWETAGELTLGEETSNAINGGYFLFALPIPEKLSDLSNLKVSVSYMNNGSTEYELYLDSIWLQAAFQSTEGDVDEMSNDEDSADEEEITPDDEPSVSRVQLALISEKAEFRSEETPSFMFSYKRDRGFFEYIGYLILRLIYLGRRPIDVQVVDPELLTQPIVTYAKDGQFGIELTGMRNLRPGRRQMAIKVTDVDSEYTQYQDYYWGALSANFNQAEYKTNQIADVFLTVLDDTGNAFCDSDIFITVSKPDGSVDTLSSKAGNVVLSEGCSQKNPASISDYIARYQFGNLSGQYSFGIVANTPWGPRKLAHDIIVSESIRYEISRNLKSRIYPTNIEEVFISFKPTTAYKGTVEERVPMSFQVSGASAGIKYNAVWEEPDTRILVWEVDLKAGQEILLSYGLDAPDISPAFYLLGPLKVAEFEEGRFWQITANGNDNAKIDDPSSVHSCLMEPFSQKIERGQKKDFFIDLMPSIDGSQYIIAFGDLPTGVSLVLDKASGTSPRRVAMTATVQDSAPTGSFSIVAIYNEPQKDGKVATTYCQFNIVVTNIGDAN